jgi:thiamine biosynthesis protein ThiS
MTYTAERDTSARQTGGASTLTLLVNGERRDAPAGSTLADFLRARSLDPRLVVVEHNRTILRDRDAYHTVALNDGDTLEIVHFVGGG